MLFAYMPLSIYGIPTPFGERLAQCVLEVPDGAVLFSTDDGGLGLRHASGVNELISVPPECHNDTAALHQARAARRTKVQSDVGSSVGRWVDNTGFTHNAGFGKFTGSYNIPKNPKRGGQILYYFIGTENLNGGGEVSILQPVLEYSGGGSWSLASWACCPSGITPKSKAITGLQTGTMIDGVIERLDSQNWQIVSTVRGGQSTTLKANLPHTYTWADVTLEVYSISSCDQYPVDKVTFSQLSIQDESMVHLTPQWSGGKATECQGVTTVVDDETITIGHNGASPSPAIVV